MSCVAAEGSRSTCLQVAPEPDAAVGAAGHAAQKPGHWQSSGVNKTMRGGCVGGLAETCCDANSLVPVRAPLGDEHLRRGLGGGGGGRAELEPHFCGAINDPNGILGQQSDLKRRLEESGG